MPLTLAGDGTIANVSSLDGGNFEATSLKAREFNGRYDIVC